MDVITRQYEVSDADGRTTQAWEAFVVVETGGNTRSTMFVEYGRTRRDALEALAFECYKAAGALHDAAEAAIDAQEGADA